MEKSHLRWADDAEENKHPETDFPSSSAQLPLLTAEWRRSAGHLLSSDTALHPPGRSSAWAHWGHDTQGARGDAEGEADCWPPSWGSTWPSPADSGTRQPHTSAYWPWCPQTSTAWAVVHFSCTQSPAVSFSPGAPAQQGWAAILALLESVMFKHPLHLLTFVLQSVFKSPNFPQNFSVQRMTIHLPSTNPHHREEVRPKSVPDVRVWVDSAGRHPHTLEGSYRSIPLGLRLSSLWPDRPSRPPAYPYLP